MRLGKALATGVAEEQPRGTDEGQRPGDVVEVLDVIGATGPVQPAVEEVPAAR